MTQSDESLELANENAYESLISLIENNQNLLSLIIVSCDDLTLRQELIGRYEREARLDNIQAKRIVLGTEPSLKAGLVKLDLPAEARVVITVTGSEWLLRVKTRASDAQSDLEKFFGYLQWTREGLRKFQYPIVLWITSTILVEMSLRAKDFWSWRKAVLKFTSDAVTPVLSAKREDATASVSEQIPVSRMDRDDDDFMPAPAEILSEINQLTARDPESANLAALYAKLAEIYTKRIARGEAENLVEEQQHVIDSYKQAIKIYQKFNKRSVLAYTLNKFGNFLDSLSHYQEAIDSHQKALEIQREISDLNGEAASLGNLGNAYFSLGEYQLAINFYQQALEIQREISDPNGEAASLGNLGNTYDSLGEYQLAINFYQQALEIQREISDLNSEGASLCNLGNTYQSLQEYQRAIDFYQQALEIQRKIGNRRGEANSLGSLGNAYESLCEHQRAIDFYQQSLAIEREIGNRRGEANSLGSLANAYNSLGEYQRATKFQQRSLEVQYEIGNRSHEASYPNNLGLAYDSLNEYQRAIKFQQQSLEIQHEIGDRRGKAISLFNQAMTLAKYEHRYVEALAQFKQARIIYTELNLNHEVEKCDKIVYSFEQIIATKERQDDKTTVDSPLLSEDCVEYSLPDNSTPSTSPQKIHWLVWFCVGLGVFLLLFLLRRK